MLNHDQLQLFIKEIKKAGDIAIAMRKEGLYIEKKQDGSKVTNADIYLDQYLCNVIKHNLKSKYTVISEEEVAKGNCPIIDKGQSFWCLDPIDSTVSYIKGRPYYCISIAFIDNNLPTIGLIYAPDLQTLWYGIVGQGAYKQIKNHTPTQLEAPYTRKDGNILVSSETHKTPAEIIKKYNIRQEIKMPSAIKFTLIPEKKAHYYIRNKSMACDWDIAAGHAIILASGGKIEFDNHFIYGQPPYLTPGLIVLPKQQNS